MTEQIQSTQEAPQAPASPTVVEKVHERVDSVEARAAELMTQLRAEQKDESEGGGEEDEGGDEPHPPSPASKPDEKKKGEPLTPEQERRARVERAAELERQNLKLNTKASEREARAAQREQQAEAREKQIIEREQKAERLMKVFESPDSLLELLTEKVPAERLAGWIVDAQKPEKRAEWAAKRAAQEAAEKVTPETAELKQRLEAMERELHAARAGQTRAHAEHAFAAKAKELAAEAPHVAAMLERKPDQLMSMAHQVADLLVKQEGSTTLDRVVEFIESDLSDYASIFASQNGSATPSAQVSSMAPVAKARTLTSRTSAGRSTLLDDEDSSKLSLDERAEQLKRLARRSG